MTFTYKTKGVCASAIEIEVLNNTVQSVKFMGGCSGNTQGVGVLVRGMHIDEVIAKLQNIRCGFKTTSCPDQLAQALQEYKAKAGE